MMQYCFAMEMTAGYGQTTKDATRRAAKYHNWLCRYSYSRTMTVRICISLKVQAQNRSELLTFISRAVGKRSLGEHGCNVSYRTYYILQIVEAHQWIAERKIPMMGLISLLYHIGTQGRYAYQGSSIPN